MPDNPFASENLRRGVTLRIKMPSGWDELTTPGALEGRPYFFKVRPTFIPPEDPRNVGGHLGLPGKYRVALVLNKPGYAERKPGNHLSEQQLEGDSNIYIGKEFAEGHVLLMKGHDRDFTIRMVPNAKGRLGKFILDELDAQSMLDASTAAWQALSAVLNLLSVTLDIPLQITQKEVVELRTGTFGSSCVIDYADIGLHMVTMTMMPREFRFHASMYREALNSNSPPYEFLCLFKILDSIGERRKRLAIEAKQKDQNFTRPAEVFPTLGELPNWLNALLPEPAKQEWKKADLVRTFPDDALGRKFSYIIDTHLRPLRNRISHGILDTGELGFSIDDPDQLGTINNLLPLTKFIVRRKLKNEFPDDFLKDVAEDGSSTKEDVEELTRKP